nr:hypothetical protein Q903MT_gene1751 [Picea sitchensis]
MSISLGKPPLVLPMQVWSCLYCIDLLVGEGQASILLLSSAQAGQVCAGPLERLREENSVLVDESTQSHS